jgi:hypothetical protein
LFLLSECCVGEMWLAGFYILVFAWETLDYGKLRHGDDVQLAFQKWKLDALFKECHFWQKKSHTNSKMCATDCEIGLCARGIGLQL